MTQDGLKIVTGLFKKKLYKSTNLCEENMVQQVFGISCPDCGIMWKGEKSPNDVFDCPECGKRLIYSEKDNDAIDEEFRKRIGREVKKIRINRW